MTLLKKIKIEKCFVKIFKIQGRPWPPTKRLCLFTFKQIVPWLIEQDDVISNEGALKMDRA